MQVLNQYIDYKYTYKYTFYDSPMFSLNVVLIPHVLPSCISQILTLNNFCLNQIYREAMLLLSYYIATSENAESLAWADIVSRAPHCSTHVFGKNMYWEAKVQEKAQTLECKARQQHTE